MKVIIGIICLLITTDAFRLTSPATFLRDANIAARAPTNLYMNKKKGSRKKKSSKATTSSMGFAGALQNPREKFPYAGSIRPGLQSPQKVVVEEGIMKPDYSDDGVVRLYSLMVLI